MVHTKFVHKQNKYFVYMHIFPNNKKYIGITSQKPERRWNNGKGYKKSTRIYNAIKKYQWINVKHIILYENLSKQKAEIKEKELIKTYKTYDDKYGYNLELGGNLNKKVSIETKKKLSERSSGKNNPMYGKSAMLGKHHTEETKKKLSEIMNSKKMNKRLSNASKGKNNPMYGVRLPESILEKKRKKVLCIETNVIYNSLKEACEKENINISCLSEVCNGKQKTTKMKHWMFI